MKTQYIHCFGRGSCLCSDIVRCRLACGVTFVLVDVPTLWKRHISHHVFTIIQNDSVKHGVSKKLQKQKNKKIFAEVPTLSASGQPPSSQFLKSLLCLVLNNYHPVALAHILMRSFEKLILHHIKDNIPASLDHHQYAFRTNRFTKNAVSTTLHNLPEEADWKTQHSGLEYLTLDSGLPHKQTPGSLDWHLHFL